MKVETYNPTHEQMTAIGERLVIIRTANELSQEEFAGRICTYVNLYCHAERGHDTIPYHAIKLTSYEFGVSLSWLLQGIPTDDDPDYCTEIQNGQSLFNSSVSIKEAVWGYSSDNGMDMWTNEVEDKREHIGMMVKYFSEHPSDLRKDHIERMTNYIDDTITLANWDGYTVGWRTAIQFVKGLLGLSGLPEEPPAAPNRDPFNQLPHRNIIIFGQGEIFTFEPFQYCVKLGRATLCCYLFCPFGFDELTERFHFIA